jgi:hypothetical protein
MLSDFSYITNRSWLNLVCTAQLKDAPTQIYRLSIKLNFIHYQRWKDQAKLILPILICAGVLLNVLLMFWLKHYYLVAEEVINRWSDRRFSIIQDTTTPSTRNSSQRLRRATSYKGQQPSRADIANLQVRSCRSRADTDVKQRSLRQQATSTVMDFEESTYYTLREAGLKKNKSTVLFKIKDNEESLGNKSITQN